LINLLHLRVLIKHNRVLVFDAYGTTDSKSQSIFMYDLDLKLRQKESVSNGTLAYEFRALEAVLISVTAGLEEEFEGVSKPVVKVLMDLEEDIDRDKLRMLLVYSKKLGSFEQKARLVRDAMTELLEADDDLSAMYLSEKSQGKEREDDDHTEVEMLLESYHKVADEIVQAAENLVSSIRNTEEMYVSLPLPSVETLKANPLFRVKAILDANRNSLMLLDLRFSILTLAITAGTFVAALYGMNLKNFIEESDLGFFGISAWCTVFGLFVAWYGLIKLRRVQRVSMWGHGGAVPGPRGGSWGLGAWGGKSSHLKDYAPAQGMHMQSFRAGESVSDIIQRERAFSRRLSKVESRAEEAAKA
jgi:magnesium transporter